MSRRTRNTGALQQHELIWKRPSGGKMVHPVAVIPASISWLGAQTSFFWNNVTPLLISLLLLALLLDYVMFRKRSRRFPPGPTPLPFLGNLLKIDFRNPEAFVQHFTKQYGTVLSLQVGWHSFVILNGFKVIKEAFRPNTTDFADRPYVPLMSLAGYTKNSEGLLLARYSTGWKEQRKFCVSTMKNFGMGRKTLEQRISEEAEYLCSEFKSREERVHEEIEEKLGRDKPPMMEDQPNLPYTNAVIHEIQRWADVVPFPFPYTPHQDVQIGKFVIPKKTIVFSHLSSVLKDETKWEKPNQFYPEHFLDASGQFVKRDAFLPFSTGQHSCPGEPLARMELFIFFTSLLQRFTFCIPENHPRPKEDRLFALSAIPPPFEICAIPK